MTATPTASYPPTKDKSSEILYGIEKAVGRGVYFMSNVRERMDIFFDKNAPSIVVDVSEYKCMEIDFPEDLEHARRVILPALDR